MASTNAIIFLVVFGILIGLVCYLYWWYFQELKRDGVSKGAEKWVR